MYFNPGIVAWNSNYRPMVMEIWMEKRSCSHDHGLNGDSMVMGGGMVNNACQSPWACDKNFFPPYNEVPLTKGLSNPFIRVYNL